MKLCLYLFIWLLIAIHVTLQAAEHKAITRSANKTGSTDLVGSEITGQNIDEVYQRYAYNKIKKDL